MNFQEARRILKIDSDAKIADVKKAFRKLAFTMHPDLNPSPDAARKFREVNEAYVFLRNEMRNDSEKPTSAGKASYTKRKATFTSRADQKTASQGAKAYQQQQKTARTDAQNKTRSASAQQSRSFYQKEEDVLKDILNDPFAKQVFEDIYRQISKDKPYTTPGSAKERKINMNWGDKSVSVDVSRGIFGGIKSWVSGQMDDEQTVFFPASTLIPGRNIRITIQQGFKKSSKILDITLPRDFIIGRPIRLKGQGRKLGPLKGDLYLRILAK
ncbi:molecular chaperone DnaJ [Maridesulfovibrio ferrireducens]|uniref:Molecular chaperone DnaJ n=1 Tax=Maridesulfovibrio ferrireducens TaxID=246191 RepID=A0A1G9HBR3_9BACT|nr:J domain-containing protein [Maridesulfovibrio ferrireducens]SDL09913.1 molecular chaperone DnaJ [Maridesulfovibrio ferrireducens]